ncbi:uncharacterized protein CPUR_07694 [Claviceps purpurea 20.1]|uniref:Uncharacterized protein n=1 Tax=Claviceps purpurea (strain 20.1) TaxID=1111077 RepID=M1WFL3_CLAP2|nr:uncharacterized protein CPUR_07694 [Claviceps purpurea 20.1]
MKRDSVTVARSTGTYSQPIFGSIATVAAEDPPYLQKFVSQGRGILPDKVITVTVPQQTLRLILAFAAAVRTAEQTDPLTSICAIHSLPVREVVELIQRQYPEIAIPARDLGDVRMRLRQETFRNILRHTTLRETLERRGPSP